MGQIYSGLGKKVKLCVRKASFLDDEMDKFGHTLVHFAFYLIRRVSKKWTNFVQFFEPTHTQITRGRDAFAPCSSTNFEKIGTSRKCSKLLAVPCAFLLTAEQNRSRLDKALL